MKCITIRQPWASLIMRGLKRIETRSRPCLYRGPIAIHAGLGRATPEAMQAMEEALREHGGIDLQALPKGVVLGTVRLVDCRPAEEMWAELTPLERALGDFSPGRWCWFLEEPTALQKPAPAVGKLSFWEWSPHG